jgi:hypothetical protein
MAISGVLLIPGEHVRLRPEDAEIASKWGNGYHKAKRNSFPVASEFSLEGDDTPLDKLTIKKNSPISSLGGVGNNPPV